MALSFVSRACKQKARRWRSCGAIGRTTAIWNPCHGQDFCNCFPWQMQLVRWDWSLVYSMSGQEGRQITRFRERDHADLVARSRQRNKLTKPSLLWLLHDTRCSLQEPGSASFESISKQLKVLRGILSFLEDANSFCIFVPWFTWQCRSNYFNFLRNAVAPCQQN